MPDRDLIAEGRRLLAAATPGPWFVAMPAAANPADVLSAGNGPVCAIGSREGGDNDIAAVADAELIVHMRNTYGELAEQLWQVRDRAADFERQAEHWREAAGQYRARITELERERAEARRMHDDSPGECYHCPRCQDADETEQDVLRARIAELEQQLPKPKPVTAAYRAPERTCHRCGRTGQRMFIRVAEGWKCSAWAPCRERALQRAIDEAVADE